MAFEDGFEYQVTVIIPVYNVQDYLREALDSLLAQTIPQLKMEVLMVNDGSVDESLAICEEYAEKYPNFKVLSQENQGVSAARNNGIRNAKGKYLMYLDGDDTLSPETVKNVTDFFDKHYEDVDIVSYPRLFCYDDGQKTPHLRDEILKKTRVYSIEEALYVNLTTVNVAVKNKKGENFLFDCKLDFHEDEVYLTAVIMEKRKFGYVREARYLYRKHGNGLTDRIVNPYFIFEPTMAFYERLFEQYQTGRVENKYIQTMVLNDFGWKIRENALFPYHYAKGAFAAAINRIENLMSKIDDAIILNHPGIDSYHKFFLLSLKKSEGLQVSYGENAIVLSREERVLQTADSVTIVVTRVQLNKEFMELDGFLKSPFFLFTEKPKLYIDITGEEGRHRSALNLMDSAHSYYKSKIKTSQFWRFTVRVSTKGDNRFGFCVMLAGEKIRHKYYFMPEIVFKNEPQQQTVCGQGSQCIFDGEKFAVGQITPLEQEDIQRKKNRWYWEHNKKFWLVRKIAMQGVKASQRIWLYSDSEGVGKDNGFYQFMHDIKQQDGVKRFYITHDKNPSALECFQNVSQKQIVPFGSKKHKYLYLICEKVITAYIELYNYIPFDWETYGNYRDINEPEIIYLQHGVLHAHMPHKYSLDRMNIDREVVSTLYEVKNLTENYHFRKENLILSGMPRYDYIDAGNEGTRKILMAPSWRQYLISMKNGIWMPEYKQFSNSYFFQSIQKFLHSKELAEMLEKYDYTLDFKLHPIFRCYQECFSNDNPRINISSSNVDASQYSIFISDFSSFSFDFVYRKCAILYFFPDYDMFKAGLMSYRELDIPLENGFGPLVETVEAALGELEKILQNGGKPDLLYEQRMNGFFLFYDNNQIERVYQALSEEKTASMGNQLLEDMLKDSGGISDGK